MGEPKLVREGPKLPESLDYVLYAPRLSPLELKVYNNAALACFRQQKYYKPGNRPLREDKSPAKSRNKSRKDSKLDTSQKRLDTSQKKLDNSQRKFESSQKNLEASQKKIKTSSRSMNKSKGTPVKSRKTVAKKDDLGGDSTDGYKPNFTIEGTVPALASSEVKRRQNTGTSDSKQFIETHSREGNIIDQETVELSEEEDIYEQFKPNDAENEEKQRMDLEGKIARQIFADVANDENLGNFFKINLIRC